MGQELSQFITTRLNFELQSISSSIVALSTFNGQRYIIHPVYRGKLSEREFGSLKVLLVKRLQSRNFIVLKVNVKEDHCLCLKIIFDEE